MRVLLAGFEPFGGETINPSWEAVRGLAGPEMEVVCLPVRFGEAAERMAALVNAQRRDLVLIVGEAGGRAAISVERIAINLRDARLPDNAGCRPVDEPVVPGGPAAHFAGVPVKAAVAAVRALGIPAEVSNSAGTYVCNDVFYALLQLAAERGGPAIGFVHVPYAPAQTVAKPGVPSMATATVAAALRAVITACEQSRDPQSA